MFCPRCRRHWQSEDSPLLLPGGRSRPARNCPACQTLLAPDRLAAEFPANEETAVFCTLTIEDVLREAAASGAVGSQTPLDEQMRRWRRSLWDHEAGSPNTLPSPLHRPASRTTPLYLALGFGSLFAIVLLVVGVFIHTIWQGAAERQPEAQSLSGVGQPRLAPIAEPAASAGRKAPLLRAHARPIPAKADTSRPGSGHSGSPLIRSAGLGGNISPIFCRRAGQPSLMAWLGPPGSQTDGTGGGRSLSSPGPIRIDAPAPTSSRPTFPVLPVS